MVLDEYVLRRLAYVKRLYMHGVEHMGNQTQVDLALAILNFDNAIEMLLSVALEFLRGGGKENIFRDILDNFLKEIRDKQLEVKISEKRIRNLHLARNKVQHNGIVPCAENVKTYQTLTEQTLAECMKRVFDVELLDVSLSMLIQDKVVGEFYKSSEKEFLSRDFYKSLVYCVAAFETAKNKEQSKLYGSGLTRASLDNNLELFVNELEVLKLRLDYKKYQKYREFFPQIKPFSTLFFLDTDSSKITKRVEETIAPTLKTKSQVELEKHARFCLEFAIENILRWESVPRIPWYEAVGQTRLPDEF